MVLHFHLSYKTVEQPLDTESYLAAVTRFIARRRHPNTIINDTGTSFVGAAKELKTFMDEWDKAKFESYLAAKTILLNIKWKDWLKITKKMNAILDNPNFNEHVLNTSMCLEGKTLNARPSSTIRDHIEDLTPLTSNHFTAGRQNHLCRQMSSTMIC